MVRFSVQTIKVKILLWVGACMLLMFGLMLAYAVVTQRSIALETAKKGILADGEAIGNFIQARIEVPLDAARTLAQAFGSVGIKEKAVSGMVENGVALSRDQINRMLKKVTASNPDFVGTYTLWEPDAFDGKDDQFKGRFPYDETGRFIAYWNRGGSGEIEVETPEYYEIEGKGDYYQLPRKRKRECIIEPYLYPVQGREVLMTSLVAPIVVDGVFRGIAGVDVGMKALQTYLEKHNPYPGQAVVSLITHGGMIVASEGNHKDLGGLTQKPHRDLRSDLAYVQSGKAVVEMDEGFITAFVPVRIGHTQTPWFVNISLPWDVVTHETSRMMWRMIFIGLILTALALALVWFVAARISRPIGRVTDAAEKISAGDLNVIAEVRAKGEAGMLAKSFNRMVANLRQMTEELEYRARADRETKQSLESTVRDYVKFLEVVGRGDLTAEVIPPNNEDELAILGNYLNQMTRNLKELATLVSEGVQNMTSATSQILAATQEQAAMSAEQAASVAQTSITMDQARRTAQQSAGRSSKMARLAKETMKETDAGFAAVQEAVAGVNRIKEQMSSIAENILTLSEQTQQIGDIIETVNDIADQSNLLALNAAIEAARAGEAGKGFAVVAGEVRNLADESRQATARVQEILGDIQKAANRAVMVTEEGTRRADAGVHQAEKAGAVICAINEDMQKGAHTLQQISVSIQDQLAGMDQISEAMQNINRTTSQTEEGTREVEESVRNLNALAEQLKGIVGRYRLN